ncbi:TniB family NTP-binding protein [Streptomyces olivoreticuli]|uniref:TniB family NTP-binding protein n=1 Tax=Streptomyces olivoreticuli TaxID=68246 RepID=UPI00265B22A5|nr:TniB family NTP-binding protein [Streptomyces olivoreticuli]WKK26927.1 TniB family NTP-binding protein [Streptomyces olivoreticuli]
MMRSYAHPGLAEPRTKTEWRGYRDHKAPARPVMPPYETFLALPKNKREVLNDARHDFHSALAIIRTAQMLRLHSLMERRMHLNAHQPPGARRGIVVDGPPTVGKSTLVKMFAADFERRLLRKYPERFDDGYEKDGMVIDYTPVVYINVPAGATPKDMSVLLADYLGLPYRAGATKTEITKNVLAVMRTVGVELVIIDDVHFLDVSQREGKIVNDHLKYLANHTAATFIYTGVDLKRSGLFLEGQGASTRATQTSARNTLHQMTKFTISTKQGKQEWAGAIMALESVLALYQHKQGQLTRLSRYLFDRTGGSICGLSDLLREGAIEAVMSGEEAITRRLLERIDLSEHAETAYRQTRRTRTGGNRPAPRAQAG